MDLVPKKANKPNMIMDMKLNSSCDYHRIVLPYSHKEFKPKVPILVYNRVYSYGLDAVKSLKSEGYKIVLDLDDYFALDSTHYLYNHFHHHTKNIIEGLKLADVVTVTTEFLASKIRHLNKNIVVIRNALPFDTGQFTLDKSVSETNKVIWAGGESHFNDLKLISGVMPETIFSLAGYNQKSEQWQNIQKLFPRSIFIPSTRCVNYMDLYNGHKVALAPLTDSFFNNCKSNLKILEAGAKGMPIICSKVLPYYNDVDKNVVLYADNKNEWHAYINKLIYDKKFYQDKSEQLKEHVRLHYDLEDANELRRQVIESFS